MNDQVASTTPLFSGAPEWLTLPFALIAAGVVFALFILFWGARLAARRRNALEEVEEYNEEYAEQAPAPRPITPPVAPPPPPLAEPPLAPPAPEPEPEVEGAAPPAPAAEAPPPPAPEPVDEAPEPAPLADEPIAAAAPLDASPAALATDFAEPAHAEPAAPEPAAPEPAPAPPPAPAADDLTRMKGVGPRLAERLNAVGILSFAQLAALTPAEADALDARLGDFQGRIHRDRWIEQAGFLAAGDIAGFEAVFGKL